MPVEDSLQCLPSSRGGAPFGASIVGSCRPESLEELARAYAFMGNVLLSAPNMLAPFGLDPLFWESFPTFDDHAVRNAVARCERLARSAQKSSQNARLEAGAEYAALFLGPGAPIAPPWETMNGEGAQTDYGFGRPTFQMRELLREEGLKLDGPRGQYEDHIGIELLLLSEYVRRGQVDKARAFVQEHPGRWIARLRDKVDAAYPEGYVSALLQLAHALLGLVDRFPVNV